MCAMKVTQTPNTGHNCTVALAFRPSALYILIQV